MSRSFLFGVFVFFIAAVIFNSPLPAGKTIGFEVSDGLWADSYNPSPKNGLNSLKNPEEWVTISCNLLNGSVFPDVINELNAGSLRIGAHIFALPDGSSELAVIIPEPITIYPSWLECHGSAAKTNIKKLKNHFTTRVKDGIRTRDPWNHNPVLYPTELLSPC